MPGVDNHDVPDVDVPDVQVNPHALVLETDNNGNEILYRTMSKEDYEIMRDTGEVPSTGETFVSPSQAYAQGYNGTLVKITVQAGTMDKLKAQGVTGNAGTQKIFPELNRAEKGWAENDQVLIKMEGQNKPEVNNGQGVVNTGLGKSKGLDDFNENIINFEKVD